LLKDLVKKILISITSKPEALRKRFISSSFFSIVSLVKRVLSSLSLSLSLFSSSAYSLTVSQLNFHCLKTITYYHANNHKKLSHPDMATSTFLSKRVFQIK